MLAQLTANSRVVPSLIVAVTVAGRLGAMPTCVATAPGMATEATLTAAGVCCPVSEVAELLEVASPALEEAPLPAELAAEPPSTVLAALEPALPPSASLDAAPADVELLSALDELAAAESALLETVPSDVELPSALDELALPSSFALDADVEPPSALDELEPEESALLDAAAPPSFEEADESEAWGAWEFAPVLSDVDDGAVGEGTFEEAGPSALLETTSRAFEESAAVEPAPVACWLEDPSCVVVDGSVVPDAPVVSGAASTVTVAMTGSVVLPSEEDSLASATRVPSSVALTAVAPCDASWPLTVTVPEISNTPTLAYRSSSTSSQLTGSSVTSPLLQLTWATSGSTGAVPAVVVTPSTLAVWAVAGLSLIHI